VPGVYADNLLLALNPRRALLVRVAARLAGQAPTTFATAATEQCARDVLRAQGFDPDALGDTTVRAA